MTGGRPIGPLHGVPVGIKDVLHVASMITTCGAAPAFHLRPVEDAPAVARLRAAGAVVVGKTHTTEFAYFEPGPTVFAEWAVDGGIDGNTRRQKMGGEAPGGKFMTDTAKR